MRLPFFTCKSAAVEPEAEQPIEVYTGESPVGPVEGEIQFWEKLGPAGSVRFYYRALLRQDQQTRHDIVVRAGQLALTPGLWLKGFATDQSYRGRQQIVLYIEHKEVEDPKVVESVVVPVNETLKPKRRLEFDEGAGTEYEGVLVQIEPATPELTPDIDGVEEWWVVLVMSLMEKTPPLICLVPSDKFDREPLKCREFVTIHLSRLRVGNVSVGWVVNREPYREPNGEALPEAYLISSGVGVQVTVDPQAGNNEL